MGIFFAYTLYSGVFLLLLYLIYKIFLSSEKQIRLNRAVLLGCYAMSFLALPLAHIEWHSAPVEIPVSDIEPDISVIAANPAIVVSEKPSFLLQVIMWIYMVGTSAVLLKTLYSLAGLMLYIRKGKRIRKDGHTLIVMQYSDTAPFSFGHYVVMSEADYTSVSDAVTAHELAHIRCRHYLDLILAQAVCVFLWYNPASWLMRDELKLLHEYQADAEVIDGGVDQKEYQMLLIRKTVGTRFHTLANNLNHSKLKKRIAMMQKEKSGGRRYLRLFSLALAVDLAVAVVNIPAVASGLNSLESTSLNVKDIPAERPSVSSVRPAEFPGGNEKLMEYLAMNLRFPESARKENSQGQSVVGFTVTVDGSLSDIRILESSGTDLDDEAIRVVKKMPKWTPAMSNGKPVESGFALPVRFILKGVEGSAFRRVLDRDNIAWLDEVEVVAYGGRPAAEPSEHAEGKWYPAVPLDTNKTNSTPSETKKLKFYPTKMVSPGTSPDAPIYVDAVLSDRDKISRLDSKSIESMEVHQLVVGPCGEKDGDASAYQAVKVDGKLLKKSMAINVDDIESFDEVAPCKEYPNGLLDIRLKKK